MCLTRNGQEKPAGNAVIEGNFKTGNDTGRERKTQELA